MASKTFREYLVELLKRGKVSDKHIDEILSEKNLKDFEVAFTHKSFDKNNNYELDEFLGDGTVNEFLVYYIKSRFPRIVSVKWLTRIKHNLASKKMLARLSKKYLESYIRYGDEIKNAIVANPDMETNIEYMSVLEDVMEAFCGRLIIIITDIGFSHGAAVQVVHYILRSFFDQEEISLKYEDVFDAVTRLKEMYDSKTRGLKWPTGKDTAYKYIKIGEPEKDNVQYEVQVFGWPKGNKKPLPENRVLLATARSLDQDVAKQQAAAKALAVLASTYGIKEDKADPYQR